MPAILDEAFTSPFIHFKALNPHGPLNPHGHLNASLNAPLNANAWETEPYKNKIPPLQISSAGAPAPVLEHAPLNMDHDCDRLIARIMSCPKCRLRIQQILNLKGLQGQGQQGTQGQQGQTGGSAPAPVPEFSLRWDSLSTTVIGNFLFGIAIIFLVDRIVRSKG